MKESLFKKEFNDTKKGKGQNVKLPLELEKVIKPVLKTQYGSYTNGLRHLCEEYLDTIPLYRGLLPRLVVLKLPITDKGIHDATVMMYDAPVNTIEEVDNVVAGFKDESELLAEAYNEMHNILIKNLDCAEADEEGYKYYSFILNNYWDDFRDGVYVNKEGKHVACFKTDKHNIVYEYKLVENYSTVKCTACYLLDEEFTIQIIQHLPLQVLKTEVLKKAFDESKENNTLWRRIDEIDDAISELLEEKQSVFRELHNQQE